MERFLDCLAGAGLGFAASVAACLAAYAVGCGDGACYAVGWGMGLVGAATAGRALGRIGARREGGAA